MIAFRPTTVLWFLYVCRAFVFGLWIAVGGCGVRAEEVWRRQRTRLTDEPRDTLRARVLRSLAGSLYRWT
jgi:hypothetical protein